MPDSSQQPEVTNLEQTIEQITDLMHKKKWQEAHRACIEVLQIAPNTLRVIRLKNKIEKQVQKNNRQALKKDLAKLKPLWKQGKTKDLMQYIKQLEPFQDQYPPLKRFIRKISKATTQQEQQEQKHHHKDELQKIETLTEQKQYQEAATLIHNLGAQGAPEAKLNPLSKKNQTQWVQSELDAIAPLLSSKNYEQALLELQRVQQIDPHSSEVRKAITELQQRYKQSQTQQQHSTVEESIAKASQLLKEKKYSAALQAAQAALAIDPHNKKAQYLIAKTQKKDEKSSRRQLKKQMKKAHQDLQKQTQQEPKSIIKI